MSRVNGLGTTARARHAVRKTNTGPVGQPTPSSPTKQLPDTIGIRSSPVDGARLVAWQRMALPYLDRAGLPQRRFRDLRHSCATLLLVQGVSPRVVMDVLGHSQIALTMNTCTHVIPELRRQAADRIASDKHSID